MTTDRVQIEFRTAIHDALAEELAADPDVIFYGEDVAEPGGVFAVTPGLFEQFGPERVFDTPISELALTGAAFGSAICGLRPVLEIMFGDFLALSMDSLVNQAAKWWYLSNEQTSVPMTIRSATGGGGRFGAIHSQLPMSWFQGVPGLKIVCPSTPSDAKALLKASIRDDNPVLFFEHKRLYSTKGELDERPVKLGDAAVVREGSDATLVSVMRGVHDCLAAAELLADRGITAEVVDLRCLRPVDMDTVLTSVAKTNRLYIVEEGPRTGGWGAEVLAAATDHALEHLDDAWRIATADHPVPYSPPLEDAFLPGPERIATEISRRMNGDSSPSSSPRP
jgi:pyruvate/2-oxoglutarate/acetoin dehydrogenase E1 component